MAYSSIVICITTVTPDLNTSVAQLPQIFDQLVCEAVDLELVKNNRQIVFILYSATSHFARILLL